MAVCVERAMPRVLPVLPAPGPATGVGLPALPSWCWQGTRDHIPARQEQSPARLLPQGVPTSLPPTAVFSLTQPFNLKKKKKKAKQTQKCKRNKKITKPKQEPYIATRSESSQQALSCPHVPRGSSRGQK